MVITSCNRETLEKTKSLLATSVHSKKILAFLQPLASVGTGVGVLAMSVHSEKSLFASLFLAFPLSLWLVLVLE